MTKKRLIILIVFIFLLILSTVLFTTLTSNSKKETIAFNCWVTGADDLLVNDLNEYLNKKGYEAYLYSDKSETDCSKIDYNILLRGEFTTYSRGCTGKKNILWQFYADFEKDFYGFGKMITIEEYCKDLINVSQNFDSVIISSKIVYEMVKDKIKVPVYYIPQFTNTDRFYYEYDSNIKSKVLFVGHWHFYRYAPMFALKNKLPISIYGTLSDEQKQYRLENNLPTTVYGTDWNSDDIKIFDYDLPYSDLNKYYSSATIVLNDTMPEMREFGFISNRIYDVSASGGFVISDYSKAIEEVYGDSIPMWKTEDEFVNLVKYYLENPDKRQEKIKKAQKITLSGYTRDMAAKKLIKVIKKLK